MKDSSKGEGPEVNIKSVTQAPVWKHLLWAIVAILGIWALSKIPSTMIVFSMAWLIAYLLNPAVDALAGKRLGPIKKCSRGQAVGIVASLLLGVMIASGSLMLPQLTDQIERLLSIQQKLGDPAKLPVMLREKAEPWLARVPAQYRETAMAKATTLIQDSASKIGHWASEIIRSVGAFIGQLLSAIFLVSSAFLVSLYMLMNWHNLAGDMLEKLPRQYQREVRSLSVKLNEIFGGYLKATILTAIACMIATFVSLLILSWGFSLSGKEVNFPYKGLVAFVAGISYPVPIIGIIATSILGGVLGLFSDGPFFGLCVLGMINVVNVLIDRTVQPRLMSDAIGVSELFVMFAAFAGGEVAGVWGMLLGIPVAAMGKTLFEWFHLNFLLVEDPRKQAAIEAQPPLKVLVEAPPTEADTVVSVNSPKPETVAKAVVEPPVEKVAPPALEPLEKVTPPTAAEPPEPEAAPKSEPEAPPAPTPPVEADVLPPGPALEPSAKKQPQAAKTAKSKKARKKKS